MSDQEKYQDFNPTSLPENGPYHDILKMAFSVRDDIKELKKQVTEQNSKSKKPLQQSAANNQPVIKTPSVLEQISLASELLTGREVMKLLKISKRTLQNYRDYGTITFARFNGKIYYPKQAIDEKLKQIT